MRHRKIKVMKKGLVRRSFWLPANKYNFVKSFILSLDCDDQIAEIELKSKIENSNELENHNNNSMSDRT